MCMFGARAMAGFLTASGAPSCLPTAVPLLVLHHNVQVGRQSVTESGHWGQRNVRSLIAFDSDLSADMEAPPHRLTTVYIPGSTTPCGVFACIRGATARDDDDNDALLARASEMRCGSRLPITNKTPQLRTRAPLEVPQLSASSLCLAPPSGTPLLAVMGHWFRSSGSFSTYNSNHLRVLYVMRGIVDMFPSGVQYDEPEPQRDTTDTIQSTIYSDRAGRSERVSVI
ncbi:hypothetical protein BC628DRAFT_230234 [Trametes gibbosa]|nr:hypothetical protein BC628DRAFT_230234 [Trametes gibbosa]